MDLTELEQRINRLKEAHSKALMDSMRAQAAREAAAEAREQAMAALNAEFGVNSVAEAAALYNQQQKELEKLLLEAESWLNSA